MPLLPIMYSEMLRRKQKPTKSRPTLPALKVVERKQSQRKHLDLPIRALSPPSDPYAEDRLPFLSPELFPKAVDDDYHQCLDSPLYVEFELVSSTVCMI